MNSALVKIVGDQDRWQSNLVDNFEKALDAKLQRANARLLANLMQRLKSDGGRFTRTAGNLAAMRWLGPAFERQLSKEGYGTLVTAFVGQFPGQFRFFDETLRLLKLPRIDWAARDRKAFETQQLTSIDALQSVVKTVGENARKRALMSVGGLKIDDLANLLHEELGKALPQAVGLADTAMSIYYATLADAGFARYEEAGVEVRFKYYGPDDRITRRFCKHLIETGRAYTRKQIGEMDNGQIPNVMVSRGGYRCRHQWILDVTGALDNAPRDPKKPSEPIVGDAKLADRLKSALAKTDPLIQRAVENAGQVQVLPGTQTGYQYSSRQMFARPNAQPEALIHELGHHVDNALGSGGMTMSESIDTEIGRMLRIERDRINRPGPLLSQLRDDAAETSIFVQDLYSALTRGIIPGGHGIGYFARDPHIAMREAFANLFTIYSVKEDWENVMILSPSLAEAFENWLKSL